MYGKIIIKAELKVLTGMHIGGSSIFSPIGAVDSPVIVNPVNNQPILPGSSLKGKLRTLLSRSEAGERTSFANDPIDVKRLFGGVEGKNDDIITARLQFADAFITNAEDFTEVGLTEVKFENTINRLTSVANPRQIERVVPGVKFGCRIAYSMENKEDAKKDLELLAKAFRLLQLDYLGGHGTRGSGRVNFEKITLSQSECGLTEAELSELQQIFRGVEEYELFSL